VAYTSAEVRALTPVRDNVEKRALLPELRDVFLCHAWDDRLLLIHISESTRLLCISYAVFFL